MQTILKFRKWAYTLAALAVLSWFATPRAQAQASTATIVGTVSDSSGALIVGSMVQAKNTGTGLVSTGTSDAQGRERIPNLNIGSYEVTAAQPGFQTVLRTGITLTVGSEPVVDFALPIGQAQQTVTVESQVSLVETQSTAVGSL